MLLSTWSWSTWVVYGSWIDTHTCIWFYGHELKMWGEDAWFLIWNRLVPTHTQMIFGFGFRFLKDLWLVLIVQLITKKSFYHLFDIEVELFGLVFLLYLRIDKHLKKLRNCAQCLLSRDCGLPIHRFGYTFEVIFKTWVLIVILHHQVGNT